MCYLKLLIFFYQSSLNKVSKLPPPKKVKKSFPNQFSFKLIKIIAHYRFNECEPLPLSFDNRIFSKVSNRNQSCLEERKQLENRCHAGRPICLPPVPANDVSVIPESGSIARTQTELFFFFLSTEFFRSKKRFFLKFENQQTIFSTCSFCLFST